MVEPLVDPVIYTICDPNVNPQSGKVQNYDKIHCGSEKGIAVLIGSVMTPKRSHFYLNTLNFKFNFVENIPSLSSRSWD